LPLALDYRLSTLDRAEAVSVGKEERLFRQDEREVQDEFYPVNPVNPVERLLPSAVSVGKEERLFRQDEREVQYEWNPVSPVNPVERLLCHGVGVWRLWLSSARRDQLIRSRIGIKPNPRDT